LQKVKGKALILAIDSALPALLAHGITPDFLSALDPDAVVYEKIASSTTAAANLNLICQLTVTPKIPQMFPANQVFWAFSESNQDRWLQSFMGGNDTFGNSLDNANMNLHAAIAMGASPIVFLGQDLAFTNNKSHSSHTALKDEDFWENYFSDNEDIVWSPGINGENLPTIRCFYDVKINFQKAITLHPNHYINASAAGLHIDGTEVLPLESVIEKYCSIPQNTAERLKRITQQAQSPSRQNALKAFKKYQSGNIHYR